jgi:transmembrane sensor
MDERIQYLFQKYLDNTCTRKEFEEFLAYVNQSGHDEQLRALIRKVYEQSGREAASSDSYVDEAGNLVVPPAALPEPAASPRPRKSKRILAFAMAAMVVLVAGGYVWWNTHAVERANPGTLAQQIPHTKKSTERSENKYLLLPDSTQVWLNVASSLEFPQQFDSNSRVVYLSGEAYFDVKHADKIPFIVHTGKITTTVLGTAFNIKAYPDRKDVIVSVKRGKVKVNYDNEEVALLTKGQQVKVSNTENKTVEKKSTANEAAAWQQGYLVYDDEMMADILADLQRVYDVNIRVVNPSLGVQRVTTSFRRETGVEFVLQVLCELTDTRFTQVNGQYIIE